MNVFVYDIIPVTKPRMTRGDRYQKRPRGDNFRAFKEEVRLKGVTLPQAGYHVIFVIPMPIRWSKRKKEEMYGSPHEQTPDKDNLEKALLDAIYDDDCKVWNGEATKIWGFTGKIVIEVEDIPESKMERIMKYGL